MRLDNWWILTENHVSWTAAIADGVMIFHEVSQKYAELKRGFRKGSLNFHEVPTRLYETK